MRGRGGAAGRVFARCRAAGAWYRVGMSANGTRTRKTAAGGAFSVGRDGIVKLNQVEGLTPSKSSERMFEDFDRRGLSAESRRRAIVEKHARKP